MLDTWLALLLVTLGLFAIAAVLGLVAVRMIKRGTPPVPELAIQEAKLTSEALKSDGQPPTTSLNGRRTPETLRREIERERNELAVAVEQLRRGSARRPNVSAKLSSHLPVVAAGALGRGLLLRRRHRRDDALPGPQGPRTLSGLTESSIEIGRAPSSPWRLSPRRLDRGPEADIPGVSRRRTQWACRRRSPSAHSWPSSPR